MPVSSDDDCAQMTNRPELQAAQELLDLTKRITYLDKASFITELDLWQERWGEFLKESTRDRNGCSTYTHLRVRSAYLSLRRNMMWLWIFQGYKHLHIPKTNNAIEGTFTDIKTKLRIPFGYLQTAQNRSNTRIYCSNLLNNIIHFYQLGGICD